MSQDQNIELLRRLLEPYQDADIAPIFRDKPLGHRWLCR